jgi:hypothetical protein
VKPDYSTRMAMTAAEKLFRWISRLMAIRCLADIRRIGLPSSFILIGVGDDKDAAEGLVAAIRRSRNVGEGAIVK